MSGLVLLTKSSAVIKLSHALPSPQRWGRIPSGQSHDMDQDTGFDSPSSSLKFRVCVETSRAANVIPVVCEREIIAFQVPTCPACPAGWKSKGILRIQTEQKPSPEAGNQDFLGTISWFSISLSGLAEKMGKGHIYRQVPLRASH